MVQKERKIRMALRKIREQGDEILRKKSREVNIDDITAVNEHFSVTDFLSNSLSSNICFKCKLILSVEYSKHYCNTQTYFF